MTNEIFSQAVPYLKPTVLDSEPAITLSRENSPVLQVVNEDLLVAYLVDSGDHFTYIQQRHLDEACVSVSQLHSIAVSNLKSLAEQKLVVREYGAVYAAFMGGNFEASLLLLDAMWDDWFSHVVRDSFMVAAPARDVLAFCDASSSEGVDELRQVIRRVENGDRLLQPHLYRREDNSWQTIA